MSLKFANHHLTRQPSHNSSLRYSALVKEDKVGYPLHAILRDLRRPLCVFNVQHDKVDVVLVGLLDLPSADTMVKDKLFTPLSCKLTPHIAVLGAIFGAKGVRKCARCRRLATNQVPPAALSVPAHCKPRTSLHRTPTLWACHWQERCPGACSLI